MSVCRRIRCCAPGETIQAKLGEIGWPAVATRVAVTYAASIVVALAAQQAGRPDLIRSPKQVLAYLWEPHGWHP
ncbi:MAG: hypothetical protein ACLQUY_06340 [Ktedonobacterales bacterium]